MYRHTSPSPETAKGRIDALGTQDSLHDMVSVIDESTLACIPVVLPHSCLKFSHYSQWYVIDVCLVNVHVEIQAT